MSHKMNVLSMLSFASLSLMAMGCGGSKSTEAKESEGELEISEILYNSSGEDSLEFVEFHNKGDKPVALAGLRISGAFDYQFDASTAELAGGKYVVITNQVELFKSRFPSATVLGPYVGKMSNAGESIKVETVDSTTVLDCEYGVNPPWATMANGGGYALVYVGGDCKQAASWKTGAKLGGNPGASDAVVADLAVSISEVMPDGTDPAGWIEFANRTSKEVDISGWLLTDSIGSAGPMTIPSNTKVPANGYLVINQADYTGDISPARSGGMLYLIATKAGTPTGSATALKFPALDSAQTAGEILLGDGSIQIGALASPTKGAENSGVKFGALQFSEIHYHPLDGEAEFVEIENTSSDSILLSDPSDIQRTWKVEGISFAFPVGASVGPKGKIVLVNENDAAAETFRFQKGIVDSVPVYTYTGKLSNSSETLVIKEPLVAVAGSMGTTNYANAWSDQVTYFDVSPWPVDADGSGKSLQRAKFDAAGSDPDSWIAATPTPGK